MFRSYPCAHSFLMLIAMLIVSASGAHAMTPSPELSCAGAQALDLNTVTNGYGAPQEAYFFSLDVPTAGVLAVDVTVPGYAEASPRLRLLDPHCNPLTDSRKTLVIERSTVHQVLAIGPGTYFVRLVAQDPRATLGSFKLTTAFGPTSALDALKSDTEIVDPDPGFAATAPSLKFETEIVDPDPGIAAAAPSLKFETEIVDPDPGLAAAAPSLKFETEIVDPDPGLASPEQANRFSGLCRQQLDDHADTFTCATDLRIGRQVDAWIGVDLEDADIFTFTLTDAETIRIGSAGAIDTFGTLYDQFGNRLATHDDGIHDGNFRIVKTLAPGRYFVRVEGRQTAGAYSLDSEILDW